jgi:hypothetical protein
MEKYEYVYDPTIDKTIKVKIQDIDNVPSAIRKMIVASRSAFNLVKHVLRIKPKLNDIETQELEGIVRERVTNGSSHSLNVRTNELLSTISNSSSNNLNASFAKKSAASNADFVKRRAEENRVYMNRKKKII